MGLATITTVIKGAIAKAKLVRVKKFKD